MPFSKLGLSPQIQSTLKKSGYITPTPIQEQVIPLVLKHNDIMAMAQTGSGKSASFVLPILELWSKSVGEGKAKIKALVLTPTRELTLQVADAFSTFGADLTRKPKVVSIIGGESIGEQIYAIQQGCDILVATSGRLLDVLSKKQTNLSHLEFFVLDEADKMLNLGFAEELDAILEAIPQKRQNLLFSATYPQKILDIASKITQNPTQVTIEQDVPTVESVIQRVIEVNHENRGPLLRHLLDNEKLEQVLVFMANKRATDNIAAKFKKYGYKAESFHGDLLQDERTYTLNEFKNKKIRILFATDIAARGLDIDDISCIINFDLPRSPTDYIHRIGRTARAGKSGVAISFISHEEKAHFGIIEKRCKVNLDREQIEGFELRGEAPLKVKGPAPIKGKGKSKKDKIREKAYSSSNPKSSSSSPF
ncbi:MAG: DEAD/DEAH box helicase [Sulfurimonas sp. RIFCSPLOWO2_12_36_12]|uniref:DEAD/DEAH box helicase n=1 Tax=Sulfurimonas sp. RIFCSPLOWO2_12_36_12 TaxID=1802253 RepID=UPI0008B56145|nr:DEAD/DEAH box helicase [Sulfurimonas sp. RIFCSPLOWO2_12_36_12]OHD97595.1 MAG: DEAD/DEAH box helicase [Sulfurimonas sp. RIFCSPLOWO2_02_FULL_36_28]OHE01861.1 MAG: DEAD/DEAH box helicase [Sulfurimonas sp. RIFCSPLOWO2_12_36_12]